MKLVIFAGGIGTRLWPLSRVNSPKQFDKIFDGKSTLRLAFDRIAPSFGAENIYIQTSPAYKNVIAEQLPELPIDNIFVEPERRDLGPAVCFAMNELKKRDAEGAVALLWADHLMERVDEFTGALQAAEELINEDGQRFVFLAERPRFANNNLGWIKVGERIEDGGKCDTYCFAGWKYRPPQDECDEIYKSGTAFWNPGYFVTSIDFLLDSYRRLAPEIYDHIVADNYGMAEALHFDEAIIERLDLSKAVVVKTNMGWSDPGTLYALKEALEKNQAENVVHGKVSAIRSEDSLLYNLDNNKVLAAVGIKGMVVVNTKDAILVAPKDEVVHITKLLKQMKEDGLEEYL
jgi:mannose-1-phosphate guanylyltransferase